jgi:hypothetical protein
MARLALQPKVITASLAYLEWLKPAGHVPIIKSAARTLPSSRIV